MQTTTVENSSSREFNFEHLAARAAKGKMLAEELAEIGKRKAERILRRGVETGEDCLDETTHYIKRHPWQSVGIAAGVGAFFGLLCGWTYLRVRK